MAEINISNINKSFGSTHVIKDVSLDIKSESFTVLVGPSGCGKSTIEKLNLSSGECTLKQNEHKVSANYVVNNKLADGVIFIPQNRRNFNRFDFSETIEISPNQSKEALNVN